MGFSLCIEDAGLVQTIDTDLAMSVDDIVVFHNNAYVDNESFCVIEKCQITWSTFFDKAQDFAKLGLILGITWQNQMIKPVDQLGKSATVNTKWRSATP